LNLKIQGDPVVSVGNFATVHHYAADKHGHGPVVVAMRPDDVDQSGRGLYTKATWRPYLRDGQR
jgi:hypothetical protein